MKSEYNSSGVGATQFHTNRKGGPGKTTVAILAAIGLRERWTLVISAAQSQVEGGRADLAELCQFYWYPLYSFALLRGRSPHDAQDLTEVFSCTWWSTEPSPTWIS